MAPSSGLMLLCFVVVVFVVLFQWLYAVGEPNRIFSRWRGMNLFSGASPTAPMLLLAIGSYAWFWYSLSGLSLFNDGRPQLPLLSDLDLLMPMFSRERQQQTIEEVAKPATWSYLYHFLLIAVPGWLLWMASGTPTTVHGLGPSGYSELYFGWAGLIVVLTLTESWQLLRTWVLLRRLLLLLDRLPLRRAFLALQEVSWNSVWKMTGHVMEQRYKLISEQFESLRHLQTEIRVFCRKHPPGVLGFDQEAIKVVEERLQACCEAGVRFAAWFAKTHEQPTRRWTTGRMWTWIKGSCG